MASVFCRRVLAVASVAMLGGALPQPAEGFAAKEPVKLTPHRAVYEVTLDDARSASGITGIDGRMVFEFSGSECNGYTLNMRMVTQMTDSQGQTNLTDLRSSTWEQGNGQKFRFQSAQYLNDKLGDVTMGRATRNPDAAVEVKLSQPNHAELNLSGKVLFPTQHSIALMNAALDGEALLQAQIYDTAFIGKPVGAGTEDKIEPPAKEKGLAGMVSWPVSIGYFESKGGDLTPSYQIDFRLYANGVSRELLIDYGDFTVHGTLSSLEYLKPTECRTPATER
jgi:envelope integrity protein B